MCSTSAGWTAVPTDGQCGWTAAPQATAAAVLVQARCCWPTALTCIRAARVLAWQALGRLPAACCMLCAGGARWWSSRPCGSTAGDEGGSSWCLLLLQLACYSSHCACGYVRHACKAVRPSCSCVRVWVCPCQPTHPCIQAPLIISLSAETRTSGPTLGPAWESRGAPCAPE